MLCSDVDAYVAGRLQAGLDAGVPAPTTTLSDEVPACVPGEPGHGHGHGH